MVDLNAPLVVTLANADEAIEMMREARQKAGELVAILYRIYTSEAWRVLGYRDFRGCIETELNGVVTWQTAYRMMQADKARANLLPLLPTAGELSDHTALTLARAGKNDANVLAAIAHKAQAIAGEDKAPTTEQVQQATHAVKVDGLVGKLFATLPEYESLRGALLQWFGPVQIEAWVAVHADMPDATRLWVMGIQHRLNRPLDVVLCQRLAGMVVWANAKNHSKRAQEAKELMDEIENTGFIGGEIAIIEASAQTIDDYFSKLNNERIMQGKIAVWLPEDNARRAANELISGLGDDYAGKVAQEVFLKLRMETPND